MKLVEDAELLIRKAWSLRLMLVAMFLTGCEAVINVVGADWMPVPKWARMLIIMAVVGGAYWARLVDQPKMRNGAQ